jgi:hypothetical protein
MVFAVDHGGCTVRQTVQPRDKSLEDHLIYKSGSALFRTVGFTRHVPNNLLSTAVQPASGKNPRRDEGRHVKSWLENNDVLLQKFAVEP